MSPVFRSNVRLDLRYFGHYLCQHCDNDWKSARTFYNPNKKVFYIQKCRQCRARLTPFKWEEINCRRCRLTRRHCHCPKNKLEDSRKPHKRHLCEKCQVDGVPCHLSASVLGRLAEQEEHGEYDEESNDEENDDQSDETDDWSNASVQGQWTDIISSGKRIKTNLWLDLTGEQTWTEDEADSTSDEETEDTNEDSEATDETSSWSLPSRQNQWGNRNTSKQWTKCSWSDEDTDEEPLGFKWL